MKKFHSLFVVLLLMLASLAANAQDYLRGDVDRDGRVNVSDVTILIDFLLQGTWPDEPVTPPDEHEWVDLGLSSGTLWATCNVGANAPEDYGNYFAWGETEPKEDYTWETYKWCNGTYNTQTKYCTNSSYGNNGFVDNKTELDLEDDAAYVNWGSSWRMPSKVEQDELRNECTWTWTTLNGVSGCLVNGPNGNTMFLPAAGYREHESLYSVGLYGYYWSHTLEDPHEAYYLLIYSGNMTWSPDDRCRGRSVRAVRVSQN